MSAFRLKFDLWLLGLVSATVEGGAISVKSFIGLAMANAAGLQVPVLNLEQLYYVFLFGAGYHFWNYLAANSLINLARPAWSFPTAVQPEQETINQRPGNTGAALQPTEGSK